jgi:hypothetical protein
MYIYISAICFQQKKVLRFFLKWAKLLVRYVLYTNALVSLPNIKNLQWYFQSTDTTYKKKNEANKKSQSSSNHNWNTLFLGVNAVADAMADKYNTTKRGILDSESSNSLAVRMALGETQVVADTRKFLTDHGVKLDVFGQVRKKGRLNLCHVFLQVVGMAM